MESKLKITGHAGTIEATMDDVVVGRLDFDVVDGHVHIMHTRTFAGNEGKGVGSFLVKEAIALVQARGVKMKPVCSFAHAYVQRHPELAELVLDKEPIGD